MNDDIVEDLKRRANVAARGNFYQDFKMGQVFIHHWGRTLTEGDNTLFVTLTMHYNPNYFNVDQARANGHAGLLVCPLLIFNTVFGLSVEDLSEAGGPFLGVDNLRYHRPMQVGETIYARSTVLALREPNSRPDYGIVTWHTEGIDSQGERVVEFERSNLVRKRK